MMNPMNQIGRGWDQNYYDNNYQQNECMFGCPMNSHCEWGFCECNAGTSRFTELLSLLHPVSVFSGGLVSVSRIGTRCPTTPLDHLRLTHLR